MYNFSREFSQFFLFLSVINTTFIRLLLTVCCFALAAYQHTCTQECGEEGWRGEGWIDG